MKNIKLWLFLLLCPLISMGQSRLTSTPGDLKVNNGIRVGNSLWVTPGLIRYHSNTWWGYNGSNWVDIGSSATETEVDNFVSNNGYLIELLINDVSLSRGYTGINHGLGTTVTADWTPNSIGDVLEVYIQASNRWVEVSRSDNR